MPNKNGLELIKPTSIASTGAGNSSSINANGSISFSSCETLSLNNVFSSTYDNYMIVMRHQHTSLTNGPAVYARLRNAGTDSTSGYTWQYFLADGTSRTGARNAAEGYARLGMTDNTLRSGLVAWIYGPFLTAPTPFRAASVAGYLNATMIDYTTTHSASSSYDGLTLAPSGGAFSGRVSVYGMRN